MNRTATTIPEPPKGYREAEPFHYSKFWLHIASLIVLVILLPILLELRIQLNPWVRPFTFITSWGDILLSVGAVLVVALVHEWLHGFTYQILGYRVHYGFQWNYLSAYAAALEQFQHRNHKIIASYIPLLVINILLLPFLASSIHWQSLIAFAGILFNTSGAVADLYTIYHLSKLPAHALLYDTDPETMLIYKPSSN